MQSDTEVDIHWKGAAEIILDLCNTWIGSVGSVKEMILDQYLLMFLWVETTITVVYVQNISPPRISGENTPEEVFTGVNPKASHLWIFSFLIYIHVPKENRMKLETSRKKGNLLDIVKLRRLTRFTSQDNVILRLVKMLLLMKI